MPEEVDDKTVIESSTIKDDKKEASLASETTSTQDKTLADIVKEIVAKPVVETEETEEEESEEGENEEKEGEEKEGEEKVLVESDLDESSPLHKNPRFQEVIKEKNTYKSQIELEKPFVDYAKSVSKFCKDNEVTGEDLRVAFELVALAKKDTKAFTVQLREILENVEVSTGERLPADLQKKVDEGIIDIETAKELTQSREAARGSKRNQEQSAVSAQQSLQQSIISSLGVWEASKRQNDVDYDKRLPLLRDRYVFLASQKPPQTSGEAVALVEQAYTEVLTSLKQFAPKQLRKVLSSTPSKGVSKDDELQPLDSLDELGSLVRKVANRHR